MISFSLIDLCTIQKCIWSCHLIHLTGATEIGTGILGIACSLLDARFVDLLPLALETMCTTCTPYLCELAYATVL